MSKLLVTIDDLTDNGGMEKRKEIYVVVLGYTTEPNNDAPIVAPEHANIFPDDYEMKGWSVGFVTPIIQIDRKVKHTFPGGLPIFYAEPGDMSMIYFSIWESDTAHRRAGEILKEYLESNKGSLQDVGSALKGLLGSSGGISAGLAGAFSLLTNGVERALMENKDDMRLSNVATFRKARNYDIGAHANWGNQRVTINTSVSI